MWMDVYLDPGEPRRTSARLYDQVRAAVAAGRLTAGDRLPTSRSLAADLGIARSTVTTVYGRLVAEGILEARVGDGTYVATHPIVGSAPAASLDASELVRRHPLAAPEPRTIERVDIDLRTGRPDPAMFPLVAWRRAVKQAAELPPPGYGDPAGLPELRSALAAWVGRSRGIDATADDVLVTAGAQQAFGLCADVLAAPDDVVAFEDPGYEPARRAFLARGLRVEAVPVDRQGLVVSEIGDRVSCVYVTPSHQAPTGVTMSVDRRRQLLELAAERRLAIIEDDYDTEFRHVDRPLEPLHRLDGAQRVVYLGTFSKTLSPSLRIGFVIAAPSVIRAFTATRQIGDVQPPHLTQAALANLIVSGDLDRHIRRSRAVLARRHAAVRAHIADLHDAGLCAAPWPSIAGLHTMLELHPGTDADLVCERLGERGILVDSTNDNWIGDPRPALSIGYGLASEAQLATAFERIRSVLTGSA